MEQIFKTSKIVIFIFSIVSIVSCQKDKSEIKHTDSGIDKNKIIYVKFPDTVKLNKVIEGTLQYDITNVGFDKSTISSRFLHLILTTNRKESLVGYDELEKDYLLGFIDSIPTGKFKIAAVFEKKGKQILNIAIRDNMFLKPDKNTPKDKMTLRRADCLFSKEVFVEE
jgi:hypothetical protein